MSRQSEFPPLDERLQECEAALEYRFNDRDLLVHALTHSSAATSRLESNERLEFLGDAILGAIVCETLYHRFPDYPEGELTRVKSALVSRLTCARVAEQLGLVDLLTLGKGLTATDEIPASIAAAVFESVLAAIYLDGGFRAASEFCERTMADEFENATELDHMKNYKSLLQQLSQKEFGDVPTYRLLDEKGPDHSKCFKVCVAIGTSVYPAAWGPSKKEAEQRAARNALHQLQGKEAPHAAE